MPLGVEGVQLNVSEVLALLTLPVGDCGVAAPAEGHCADKRPANAHATASTAIVRRIMVSSFSDMTREARPVCTSWILVPLASCARDWGHRGARLIRRTLRHKAEVILAGPTVDRFVDQKTESLEP